MCLYVKLKLKQKCQMYRYQMCLTTQFSADLPNVVHEHFIKQLRAHGIFDQFLAKAPDEPHNPVTGFFSLTEVSQVNLIQNDDFKDVLNDLPNRFQTIDLKQEQQNDELIRGVIFWTTRVLRTNIQIYLLLGENTEKFTRLLVEDDSLYRLFHDDCGKVK